MGISALRAREGRHFRVNFDDHVATYRSLPKPFSLSLSLPLSLSLSLSFRCVIGRMKRCPINELLRTFATTTRRTILSVAVRVLFRRN